MTSLPPFVLTMWTPEYAGWRKMLETNMAARRELNGIHRARLTGDDLVVALERLYTKYRLKETRGDTRELRRRGEVDPVPRIVVSEAIGRA